MIKPTIRTESIDGKQHTTISAPGFSKKNVIFYVITESTTYEANDLTQVLKLWAKSPQDTVLHVGRNG